MLKLTLVTPTKRAILGEDVEEIFVPAYRGELNILPGHATLITTLTPGVFKYKKAGATVYTYAAISWGYCEVFNDSVSILAETVESPKEIDVEKAKATISEAESKLASADLTPEEMQRFRKKQAVALARIETADHKYVDV